MLVSANIQLDPQNSITFPLVTRFIQFRYYWLFSDPNQGRDKAAYAFGSLEKGSALIAFRLFTGKVAPHEIFHVAAKTGIGYSHVDMALAASKSAGAMKLKVFSDFPTRDNYKDITVFDSDSATYFGQAIFDACVRIKPVWVTK